jgi:acetylornithine deacetylase/succinyl-diaminopimelate desuccinylase-like protein
VKTNRINTADLLKKLISIPSPFFREEKIAEFLEGILMKMGFRTNRQIVERKSYSDGLVKNLRHFNVTGEKGSGNRSFLLYAHMDTVPVVNAWYEMGLDPFEPVIRDNKMYGLGSADMKSGIVAILKAVEGLEPEGYNLKICFGVDEENESMGAYVLVNSLFIDDCVACIVPEVGSGNAEPARENLVTGRHGRNRVGIRITGRAAHASTPEFIINPVEYAFEFINAVKNIDLGNDPDMPPDNVSIAGIHAESGGLSSPEECIIWFDNLFSPPQKSETIFGQYRNICSILNEKYRKTAEEKGYPFPLPRFSVIDLQNQKDIHDESLIPRATPFMEPWKIDRDHPLVKTASDVIRDITGKEAVLTCGRSNADENYIGQKVPTIVIPPRGGNEHQGGEYVFLDSIDDTANIIRKIVVNYLRG